MELLAQRLNLPVSSVILDSAPEEWLERARRQPSRYRRMAELGLGFDVTSFGTGNFFGIHAGLPHQGLALITVMNGRFQDPTEPVTYAEKYLFCGWNQRTPPHFHPSKTETIAVVEGAMSARVWAAAPGDVRAPDPRVPGALSRRGFRLEVNSLERACRPGQLVRLSRGDAVTFYGTPPPRSRADGPLYHEFWGSARHAFTTLKETSRPNEDRTDNRFLRPADRYDNVEEDEGMYRLLCNQVQVLFTGSAAPRRAVEAAVRARPAVTQRQVDRALREAGALTQGGSLAEDAFEALRAYRREKEA